MATKKPFPANPASKSPAAKAPAAKAKPGMAAMLALANRPKAKKKG